MSATSPRSSIEGLPGPALAGALLLGLLVCRPCPPCLAAQGEPGAGTDVGRQARAVLADPRFQRGVETPRATAASRGKPDQHDQGAGWQLPEEPPAPSTLPSLGGARQVLLVCGGLAIGLALLGLVVTRAAPLATPPAAGAEGGEALPAGEAREAAGDPEQLAAQGRYGEAMHALLLVAIAGLAQRCLHPPSPSRTSRELIRQLPLRPEAREAFAGLVAAVELNLFGGVPAGEEDYRRNLDRFQLISGRAG